MLVLNSSISFMLVKVEHHLPRFRPWVSSRRKHKGQRKLLIFQLLLYLGQNYLGTYSNTYKQAISAKFKMSSSGSFRHHLLPSGPLVTATAEEPRRTCWYLLTMILSLLSSAFACFLLVNCLMQYFNVDHILEECTIDWNVHVPCHYLGLWLRFHGPESLYDKRQFIIVFNSIIIALSISFLVRYTYIGRYLPI